MCAFLFPSTRLRPSAVCVCVCVCEVMMLARGSTRWRTVMRCTERLNLLMDQSFLWCLKHTAAVLEPAGSKSEGKGGEAKEKSPKDKPSWYQSNISKSVLRFGRECVVMRWTIFNRTKWNICWIQTLAWDHSCFYKWSHYKIKTSMCFKPQTSLIRYQLSFIPN